MGIESLVQRGPSQSKVIIELDLSKPLVEKQPSPVAAAVNKTMELRRAVDGLARAADDPNVVALFARIDAGVAALADAQELRDAVLRFRRSGKPAVAFADTFGEFGRGTTPYFLATGFDDVWLQPSGDLGFVGWAVEQPFLRGVFDKVGVEPRMDHRHEYKNAKNMFTERSFTEPHREALEVLARSQFDQVVAAIADARGLDEKEVRALADTGPLLGPEALAARLVDHLGYRDEAVAAVKERAGAGAELLYLQRYLKAGALQQALHKRQSAKKPVVALVHGAGPVVRGRGGGFSPLTRGPSMGGEAVAAAIRAAVADERVKAIVFRVDSPGGSYVASDTVWREVVRAREGGTPVVVSMGKVAGSGGYFVAMGADRIVAQPATITGSIGVVGGKQLLAGLKDKVGLTTDEVHDGETALMFSSTYDFSDAAWARLQAWLDRCYEDFTSKVAAGRNLPLERVREIAKGRIWSGADAKERGLVDELGGVYEAVAAARSIAGLGAAGDVDVVPFPRKTAVLQRLAGGPSSSDDVAALAPALGVPGILARLGLDRMVAGAVEATPAGDVLTALGVALDQRILTMPVVPTTLV